MSAASLVVKRLLEKKPKTRQDIQLIKLEVAREEKFDAIPPNNQLLAEINAKEEPELAKLLRVKPMRTSAGVTPVAIMTSPAPCPHGTCTFCPGGPKNDSLNHIQDMNLQRGEVKGTTIIQSHRLNQD